MVYGKVNEIFPDDYPTLLGKPVTLIIYTDANLMHNVFEGKLLMGILHLMNQTPIKWYMRRQPTVEMVAYGAEFIVARMTMEQRIDLRATLHYLGVNINGSSYLFGDNRTAVDSSSVPK